MNSTIVGIEGLNFRPNSPKNSLEKFSLFSHKHDKNNNEMGYLFFIMSRSWLENFQGDPNNKK
jgi:hypothetical protein